MNKKLQNLSAWGNIKWTTIKPLAIGIMIISSASGSAQTEFKRIADDGAKEDSFGISVAASGDYAVVGASGDDDLGDQSGSAYIFEHDGGNWIQMKKLIANDGAKEDAFGISVAISGDYVIIGANGDDDLGDQSGSAYIFKRNGSDWTQVKKLTANDGTVGDLFGSSVSINETYAIVGAPGDDDWGAESGSAYLFRHNGADWIQVTKLRAYDGAQDDRFGISVAISDDYAVIGANGDDRSGEEPDLEDYVTDAGSAYIFRRTGTNWLLIKKLVANDGTKEDWFGTSVAISGNYVIVGANGDDNFITDSGSAYIFDYNGVDWIQVKKLAANDRDSGDGFGNSVAIRGDYAFVGASNDNDLGDQSGSAYIFNNNGVDWIQVKKLMASDGIEQDLFGFSVAVSDDFAIVGANGDDDLGDQSGSMYIYDFAAISVTPLSLDFADSLNTQSFTLTNDGIGGTLQWTISTDQSWIRVIPDTGSTIAEIDVVTVMVDRTSLPVGNHRGTVTVNSNVGNVTVDIIMSVFGAPAVNTDSATNVDTTTAILNGTVNPNGLITNVMFEYGLTMSYGNTVAAAQSPVTGTNPVSVSAEITGLSQGVEYHYRVIATSIAGTAKGEDFQFTTYPATFALNTTINFPTRPNAYDYNANEYRILGLPGASNQLVADFLSGVQNEDWQIFWDNGDPNNFLVEYDGSENFRFTVGRAFWIINKGPLSISTTVPAEPLNAVGEVEIPLGPGFNLITNPFTTSISWTEVQNLDSNIGPIFSYLGSFVASQRFDPFVGYYYFNDNNLASLKIPFSLTFSPTSDSTSAEKYNWAVNISLLSDTFSDQSISLGTASKASAELDRFDYRKPRSIAPMASLYFNRPNWDSDYRTFATDIRPRIKESEIWEFQVYSTQRRPIHLTFTNIESIPLQFEAYLLDDVKGDYVNLRSDANYRFVPQNDVSNLQLLLGKVEVVEETLNSVLPTKFAVGNNYPNPFNPTTNIPISVPVSSRIDLKIYSILGKEVRTVYTGRVQAGKHLFSWNGKDDHGNQLASGVYLYRLTTHAQVSLTGKMILMK